MEATLFEELAEVVEAVGGADEDARAAFLKEEDVDGAAGAGLVLEEIGDLFEALATVCDGGALHEVEGEDGKAGLGGRSGRGASGAVRGTAGKQKREQRDEERSLH